MGKKGIEDMISELEIFVDNCKFQPLSSSKIVVPKEELMLMLKELRLKMPSEIERCQKIMRNKEAIVEEAKREGNQVIDDARKQAAAMVNESVIMQAAREEADTLLAQASADVEAMVNQAHADVNSLVESASLDAGDLRIGAMNYTNTTLYEIENFLQLAVEEENRRYQNFYNNLQDKLNTVSANRHEIEAQLNQMTAADVLTAGSSGERAQEE